MVELYRSLITQNETWPSFLYAHRLTRVQVDASERRCDSGARQARRSSECRCGQTHAGRSTRFADYQVCDAIADRVLCGPADLSVIPVLARTFPDSVDGPILDRGRLQSADRPYLTDFMRILNSGDIDSATEQYWKARARGRVRSTTCSANFLLRGSHPVDASEILSVAHRRANGGLLRAMHGRSDTASMPRGRERIAQNLRNVGIPLTDRSLDEFVVGAETIRDGKNARPTWRRTPCWS